MEYDPIDLITTMYQNDDAPNEARKVNLEPSGVRRTRDIQVGAIKYEVPTIEYLNRLEQMIMAQAQIIEKQRRDLSRLDSFVISTRNFIRRQTTRIGEMQINLDSKLDVRDSL
jgi:hypothetical protein